MKLRLYTSISLFFALLCCLPALHINAQQVCTNRYLDTLFSSIDTTMNVQYTDSAGGTATPELLDIYQPAGDTACLRHLVIFVHGGAFFQGTKNDGDMEFLCRRFAQRGYVCATINYRLAGSVVALYDSAQIFTYMMKAISDMKASIRYFYKDASLTNQWKIDTNSIFIGGSSAGAIAADYVALVDSVNELAPPFQTICNSNGGVNGNSGNSGYSTRAIAVASLAGAIDDLKYIKPGSPPMVFCQGTADGTIPYHCGEALTQYTLGLYPTIRYCGSAEMSPALDSLGIPNSLMPFPGSGHVPWDTNTVIENRMDSAVAAFFYSVKCTQQVCSGPSAVTTLSTQPTVSIYPNPTHQGLNVTLTGGLEFALLRLYDCTGREVKQLNISSSRGTLSVDGLAKGVYTLRLDFREANTIPMSQKVVVE